MSPRWRNPPEAQRQSDESRAANLLGTLALGLADRIEEAVAESLGTSTPAVAALHWIQREPGLRSEDLRQLLGMSQSSSARLVSMLLTSGLVLKERSRRDLRVMKLRLSDLGTRSI